ncbi:MAG TPA: SDR family NAD(P)-dependent oxidoreductase [Dehalococcoidia bacterium]|nr:SDR family NAD(P)-dependent oxidoreductase [Dehalococcoidia bacterium]
MGICSGKVALVTGAGRGIGRAIALALAGEGADVGVDALHLSSAEETVKTIKELGQRAIAIEADVAEADQVKKMIGRVIDELGSIDILVNNAGVNLEIVPTVEQSLEKWDRMMSVNVRGTYLCCREAGKWMIAHRRGKIINIASIFGIRGFPMRTAYSPSKAAIINMTMDLAAEWGKYNINVNCIAPGFVLTDMVKNWIEQGKFDLETLQRRTPLGRLTTPEDIAKAAIFLSSDEANNITGVTLPVDGGWISYGYI